ncbi:hypothetical protein E2F48_15050 [Arthrobacter crusticola]|uniref:Uncharacterized protein n=1 Tax=Arthrobacter crusticola TaxID=2547960 RepID=A0A4R5TNW8_9MICC|nr:hypothetical protein [Arthrobacter crusticola]TDK24093.1 hypothetical protein E2F48_15050 [Arthrobacter crusticola]
MVCTSETGYGSGCYEGELMIVSVLFGAFFLMHATFSSIITEAYGYNLSTRRKWWPVTVSCVPVLMTVAVVAFNFAIGPGQYP